jgi:hypothetical protein
MVRVDRLYLGPMSAPEPMGSDQIKAIELKLGRELLPAPVFSPVYWAFLSFFEGRRFQSRVYRVDPKRSKVRSKQETQHDNSTTRKTKVADSSEYQKMEEKKTIRNIQTIMNCW